MIQAHINKWIENISTPAQSLEGFAVCPYAKTAKYKIIEYTGKIEDLENNHLLIFVLPDEFTLEMLEKECKILNRNYPELVFLPDHKNADTNINGIATGNGMYNLILCQRRSDLIRARSKLGISGYYDLWSLEYYKKIMDY